jgi:hypothetical protein
MRTIEIEGTSYKVYRVGIGYPAFIYYNVASKEAVAVPAVGGRDPAAVLLEAVMAAGPPPEPELREVTDAEKWRAMTARFRN